MGEISKKLLGRDIVFSEAKVNYNELKKEFAQLAKESMNALDERYSSSITNYSDYLLLCRSLTENVLLDYLQIGVRELIKNGIYNVDEIVLKQEMSKDTVFGYNIVIDDFIRAISDIDQSQAENNQMAGDIALGGATSLGLGLLGGDGALGAVGIGAAAIGAGVAVASSIYSEKKKEKLFNDLYTKQSLLISIKNDVSAIYKTVARITNERSNSEVYRYALCSELEEIEPICRNAFRCNFREIPGKSDLEIEQILGILDINPYDERMYSKIMLEYGGLTPELKEVMEFLAIDLSTMADVYFSSKYDMEQYTTYEAMCDFVDILEKNIKEFDVDTCDYLIKARAKKQRLYDIRRTFNDYIYDTIELRDFAEKQYNEFLEDDIQEMTIDELLEKHEKTFASDMTEKNRDDLQKIVVGVAAERVKAFTESEALVPYVEYAEAKRVEHGLETSDLLKVIQKKYKSLMQKEKFNENMQAAKDKAMAFAGNMAGFAKNAADNMPGKAAEMTENAKGAVTGAASGALEKGKGLMGKLPFGKKEQETKANVTVASEPVINAASATVENVASATKTCPQCGGMVKAEGKFCGKCGYRF